MTLPETASEDEPRIPLAVRLKAWWQGYEARDLWDRLKAEYESAGDDPGGADVRPEPPAPEAPEPATAAPEPQGPEPQTKEAPPVWNAQRVEIAQYVWGEGFCGPGGPDYVVKLSKLLALSPKMSVLILGAALGGPARVLAKNFGAWITGYETSPELVEEGNRLSEAAGLAKKVQLVAYDFEHPEELDRQYDRVFSKEALFTVKNKLGLLKRLFSGVKPDALVLITDYVVAEESHLNAEEIRDWREAEPRPIYLVTAEQLADWAKDAGFNVRVSEDISDHYIRLIADSWADAEGHAAALMKQGDDGPAQVETLLHEAEFWARRSRLLTSGKLRLWRIVAHKKGSTSLMSDW